MPKESKEGGVLDTRKGVEINLTKRKWKEMKELERERVKETRQTKRMSGRGEEKTRILSSFCSVRMTEMKMQHWQEEGCLRDKSCQQYLRREWQKQEKQVRDSSWNQGIQDERQEETRLRPRQRPAISSDSHFDVLRSSFLLSWLWQEIKDSRVRLMCITLSPATQLSDVSQASSLSSSWLQLKETRQPERKGYTTRIQS